MFQNIVQSFSMSYATNPQQGKWKPVSIIIEFVRKCMEYPFPPYQTNIQNSSQIIIRSNLMEAPFAIL